MRPFHYEFNRPNFRARFAMTTMKKPRVSRASVSRTPYSTTLRSKAPVHDGAASSGTWFITVLTILLGVGFLAVGAITYILLLG